MLIRSLAVQTDEKSASQDGIVVGKALIIKRTYTSFYKQPNT